MERREEMIAVFHDLGMSQIDTLHALAHYGYIISQRHLRRILCKLALARRKNYSNVADVINFIRTEIAESGMLHGYRWMWQKCLDNGLRIPRHYVQIILSHLDPEASLARKSRRLKRRYYISNGPNYVWHIDGNDKLKPYGFGISGCIDGFSRHLIWMNVYTTNKNPAVIGGYFYEAIEEYSGCPKLVRADAGTENVIVRDIQMSLMSRERTGLTNCYIEGTSTLNQRIECFWSQLRKECLDYWICMFHDLKENGKFLGNFIDINLLQFCFMAIIQCDLHRCKSVWNNHKIRTTRNGLPSGRPSVMFEVPSIYGTVSHLVTMRRDQVETHKPRCIFRSSEVCDADIYQLCICIMRRDNLNIPMNSSQGLQLYLDLRHKVNLLLNV